MKLLQTIFFIFTLISGIFAITSKNPVISVVFVISTFINAALYLIFQGISFMGISYVIVYVGAITVLFLFVIMMINIKLSEILDVGSQYTKNLPLALIISLLFLFIILKLLSPEGNNINLTLDYFINILNYFILNIFNIDLLSTKLMFFNLSNNLIDGIMSTFSHIKSLGCSFYTNDSILLIILGVLLLLAMTAIIFISKNKIDNNNLVNFENKDTKLTNFVFINFINNIKINFSKKKNKFLFFIFKFVEKIKQLWNLIVYKIIGINIYISNLKQKYWYLLLFKGFIISFLISIGYILYILIELIFKNIFNIGDLYFIYIQIIDNFNNIFNYFDLYSGHNQNIDSNTEENEINYFNENKSSSNEENNSSETQENNNTKEEIRDNNTNLTEIENSNDSDNDNLENNKLVNNNSDLSPIEFSDTIFDSDVNESSYEQIELPNSVNNTNNLQENIENNKNSNTKISEESSNNSAKGKEKETETINNNSENNNMNKKNSSLNNVDKNNSNNNNPENNNPRPKLPKKSKQYESDEDYFGDVSAGEEDKFYKFITENLLKKQYNFNTEYNMNENENIKNQDNYSDKLNIKNEKFQNLYNSKINNSLNFLLTEEAVFNNNTPQSGVSEDNFTNINNNNQYHHNGDYDPAFASDLNEILLAIESEQENEIFSDLENENTTETENNNSTSEESNPSNIIDNSSSSNNNSNEIELEVSNSNNNNTTNNNEV